MTVYYRVTPHLNCHICFSYLLNDNNNNTNENNDINNTRKRNKNRNKNRNRNMMGGGGGGVGIQQGGLERNQDCGSVDMFEATWSRAHQ